MTEAYDTWRRRADFQVEQCDSVLVAIDIAKHELADYPGLEALMRSQVSSARIDMIRGCEVFKDPEPFLESADEWEAVADDVAAIASDGLSVDSFPSSESWIGPTADFYRGVIGRQRSAVQSLAGSAQKRAEIFRKYVEECDLELIKVSAVYESLVSYVELCRAILDAVAHRTEDLPLGDVIFRSGVAPAALTSTRPFRDYSDLLESRKQCGNRFRDSLMAETHDASRLAWPTPGGW